MLFTEMVNVHQRWNSANWSKIFSAKNYWDYCKIALSCEYKEAKADNNFLLEQTKNSRKIDC